MDSSRHFLGTKTESSVGRRRRRNRIQVSSTYFDNIYRLGELNTETVMEFILTGKRRTEQTGLKKMRGAPQRTTHSLHRHDQISTPIVAGPIMKALIYQILKLCNSAGKYSSCSNHFEAETLLEQMNTLFENWWASNASQKARVFTVLSMKHVNCPNSL